MISNSSKNNYHTYQKEKNYEHIHPLSHQISILSVDGPWSASLEVRSENLKIWELKQFPYHMFPFLLT